MASDQDPFTQLFHSAPPEPKYECFTQSQSAKIAKAIVGLKVCESQLSQANAFIVNESQKQKASNPWWLEPSVVGGGMVISFGLGGLVFFHLDSLMSE